MIKIGFLFRHRKTVVNQEAKINTIRIQQATVGVCVPLNYGTNRLSFNLVQYENFTANQHVDSSTVGGKGGGGTTTQDITYTYQAAVVLSLCEGEVKGIGKLYYNQSVGDFNPNGNSTLYSDQGVATVVNTGLSLFNGTPSQQPWSYITSVIPSHALPYAHTAYVAGFIDLTSDGSIPNYSFEVNSEFASESKPWELIEQGYKSVKVFNVNSDLFALFYDKADYKEPYKTFSDGNRCILRKYNISTGVFDDIVGFTDHNFDNVCVIGDVVYFYYSSNSTNTFFLIRKYSIDTAYTNDFTINASTQGGMQMCNLKNTPYLLQWGNLSKIVNSEVVAVSSYTGNASHLFSVNDKMYLIENTTTTIYDGINFTHINSPNFYNLYNAGIINNNLYICADARLYILNTDNTWSNYSTPNYEPVFTSIVKDNILYILSNNSDIFVFQNNQIVPFVNLKKNFNYSKSGEIYSAALLNNKIIAGETGGGYNIWEVDSDNPIIIARDSSYIPAEFSDGYYNFAVYLDTILYNDGKVIYEYVSGQWKPFVQLTFNADRIWVCNGQLFIRSSDHNNNLYTYSNNNIALDHTFNRAIIDIQIFENEIYAVQSDPETVGDFIHILFTRQGTEWQPVEISKNGIPFIFGISRMIAGQNTLYFMNATGVYSYISGSTIKYSGDHGIYPSIYNPVVYKNQFYTMGGGNSYRVNADSSIVLDQTLTNLFNSTGGECWSACIYNDLIYFELRANNRIDLYHYDGVTLTLDPTGQIAGGIFLTGLTTAQGNLFAVNYDQTVTGTFVMKNESTSVSSDVAPYRVIKDLLTNNVRGLGLPTTIIDDESFYEYNNYCVQNNFYISMCITEAKEARDIISDICLATNSTAIMTNGKIKIVPYLDDLTPIIDIGIDDLQFASDKPPVNIQRVAQSDIYNSVSLEFDDRSSNYNSNTVEVQDQAMIDYYGGINKASPVQLNCIKNITMATTVANIILQKGCSGRNTYTFSLGLHFIFLECMDVITLSDSSSLYKVPVRITDIKTDRKAGNIEFTAADYITGTSTVTDLVVETSQPTSTNKNVDGGSIELYKIIEPTFEISKSNTIQIWGGVSSSNPNWGGCNMHVSWDNTTYKYLSTVYGKSKLGILKSAITAGAGIDDTNILELDLSKSLSEIVGLSQADFNNNGSLSIIDDEYICYRDSELVSKYNYDLSHLARGLNGSNIVNHDKDAVFLRINNNLFKETVDVSDIGKTLYIKFTSFNIFTQNEQDISTVTPIQYVIKGTAMKYKPQSIPSLWQTYENNNAVINWNGINDSRSIFYEIRLGSTWNNAITVGITQQTKFAVSQSGNYLVAPFYQDVYSESQPEIQIDHYNIATNFVINHDEKDNNFNGLTQDGAILIEGAVKLINESLFDSLTDNIDLYKSWDYLNATALYGVYNINQTNVINLGSPYSCNINAGVKFESKNISGDAGNYNYLAKATIQINSSIDGINWIGWQDFYAGKYYGSSFNFRVLLQTNDSNVTIILHNFNYYIERIG